MTAFELHLLFNQRYKEIASKKRDKLFPQEVDSFLNIAQARQLQSLVKNGLQDDQTSLQAISSLITKNKQLDVIIPSSNDPIYEDDIVYSVLPPNLAYLVNSRVTTIRNKYNCDVAPVIANITRSEWVAVVPFPTAEASAPFYVGLEIKITNPSTTLYTAPQPYAAGFSNVNSKHLLINAVIDHFNRATTPINLYWERYRDKYYKDSFIFVGSSNYGTAIINTTTVSSQTDSVQNTYSTPNLNLVPSLVDVVIKKRSFHPSEITKLYQMRDLNIYYAPKDGDPIIEQTEDYLIAHKDESSLITRMVIDYIRKPRHINLDLNQSCEFGSNEVQGKIVDLAVELARLDTMNPLYQQTVQDTEIRNKI